MLVAGFWLLTSLDIFLSILVIATEHIKINKAPIHSTNI